jgi:hypothetical protein
VERRDRLEQAVPDAVRAHCPLDIVLATGRFVFGSTTESIVRHASCAVLTLRCAEQGPVWHPTFDAQFDTRQGHL